MNITEKEILSLKQCHNKMWELVDLQVVKAFDSLLNCNKDLAREVIMREKIVNAQEIVNDTECENFIALFAPVAVDLRYVLSLLKINNNLERIGDFAESIARYVVHTQSQPLDEQLFQKLELQKMTEEALNMLREVRLSLETEDSKRAVQTLALDDELDRINRNATVVLTEYITANPNSCYEMIHLNSVIRRIERIGDRCSNIAEDIVFYIDALEMRHLEKVLI